jgi:phosphoribosyl-AMP cyclohydrolase
VGVDISKLRFDRATDLIPVVVQEERSLEVLMLAYANRDALLKTMETGYAHYWSRERKFLWKKGETSGNVQRIVDIVADCDTDAILYVVEQTGVACHTGARSCFHNSLLSTSSNTT